MAARIDWTQPMLVALPNSRGEAMKLANRYYYTGKPCKQMHVSPRRTADGKCLDCFRVASARSKRKWRLNMTVGEKSHVPQAQHGLTGTIEMMLWIGAKNRARKKGLEFTIKPTDVVIPDFYPILGISLEKTWGARLMNNEARANAPSLDRIDPRKGYVTGNVVVISYRANMIKGDGLPQEHRLIAEFIKNQVPVV